jgi:hypothetical protein
MAKSCRRKSPYKRCPNGKRRVGKTCRKVKIAKKSGHNTACKLRGGYPNKRRYKITPDPKPGDNYNEYGLPQNEGSGFIVNVSEGIVKTVDKSKIQETM